MRPLISVAFLVGSVALGGRAIAQPQTASGSPTSQTTCATCHGLSELWEGDNRRLFVNVDQLANDVHGKHGVTCNNCHGGNPDSKSVPQAHSTEVAGANTHARPFKPALSQPNRTWEHLNAIVQVCGNCHPQAAKTYGASVHGHALQESGLVVTAVCTDCHGAHGIDPTSDPRSPLNPKNVSETCAKCHQYIEERLQKSVHGSAFRETSGKRTAAAAVQRKPGCTDCHQGHDIPHPRSAEFRLALPDRCGNCHANLSNTYTQTLHGKLTELGYVPAAKCSDCHGSHDILPISNPKSRLSAANRQKVCSQCHLGVNANFVNFDPHANPSDPQRNAFLYWVNVGLTGLLFTVFGIFGIHSLLWLVRSLPHVLKHGRPKYPRPGARAYLRFRPVHRMAHAVLMTSFLGLALTGLPLKYTHYVWAQDASRMLGGFASTAILHRLFGIANFCCLVFYVIWFGWQLIVGPGERGVSRLRYMFSPDSPVPQRRDLSDFAKMMRWFFYRGPKPTFERWSYWEKFDLWAAGADIVLIGTTGFILWFPNQFCSLFPGRTLSVADLIHGKLALLATGFVFAIHFFNSNLRPEKFPMDISILTGVVSEEEMEEERPELVKRLKESGRMDQYITEAPAPANFTLAVLGGVLALSLGLALLVGILIAVF
jgi:cytochrome b subunit of formate dehydrogenase